MIEFNIAPNTQVGRIVIPEQVYEHENVYHTEPYNRAGEFVEAMVSDTYSEFCRRWFHLAGFKELLEDIDEYYNRFGYGKYSELVKNHSPILPTIGGITPAIQFGHRYNGIQSSITLFDNSRPSSLDFKSLSEVVNG